MSIEEENKALVRRYFDEIMNKGDRDAIRELIAPECVFTIPTLPDPFYGPEGYEQLVTLLRTAFPDLLFKVEDEVAEGDTVVDRWTATGTSRGPFSGSPPSGNSFQIEGIGWYRLENGRFVENRVTEDTLGLLIQIGALPSPAAPGPTGTMEIVEAYYRHVNVGDWSTWLTLFSERVVCDEQLAGHLEGVGALRSAAEAISTGYSRFQMHPERIVVQENRAGVIWRLDAASASGIPIAYTEDPSRAVIGANYFEVEDGLIIYLRSIHDSRPFEAFINQ